MSRPSLTFRGKRRASFDFLDPRNRTAQAPRGGAWRGFHPAALASRGLGAARLPDAGRAYGGAAPVARPGRTEFSPEPHGHAGPAGSRLRPGPAGRYRIRAGGGGAVFLSRDRKSVV